MAIDYDVIFQRLGFLLGCRRRANYLAEVMGLYDPKVWTLDDVLSGRLYDWSFTGLKKGVNTYKDGKLWVTFDDTAGTRSVDVYKASAKTAGDRVCYGTRSGDGVMTLGEDNNSGLTGSVAVEFVGNGEPFDAVLIVNFSWKQLVDALTKDDDDKDRAKAQSDLDTATQNALDGFQAEMGDISSALLSVQDEQFWLGLVAILIDSGETTVWSPTEVAGAAGEVTITKSGILQDLIDAMIDDAKSVLENTVTFPAFAGVGTPEGDFTQTSRVAYQYVRNERIRLRCTKTLTGTLEEFSVTGGITGAAPLALRLGSTFRSSDLGIEILLERKITEASAALSNVVVSGETNVNTSSEGKLYTKLTNPSGTLRLLEIFTHSSRTDEFKVAEGQRDGDGAIVCTAYGAFGGLLRVEADVVYTGDEDSELDLNVSQVNDLWEADLTNDEAGIFVTMIGRIYPGAALPTDSSPTQSDDSAKIVVDEMIDRTGWEGLT